MNVVPQEISELARRLTSHEGVLGPEPAAVRVSDKLRAPLRTLAGSEGYRSLLNRAVTVAAKQEPELAHWRTGPDGVLHASPTHSTESHPEAEVLLVAHLIQLLTTFIGPSLTFNLIRDAWPQLNGDAFPYGDPS